MQTELQNIKTGDVWKYQDWIYFQYERIGYKLQTGTKHWDYLPGSTMIEVLDISKYPELEYKVNKLLAEKL